MAKVEKELSEEEFSAQRKEQIAQAIAEGMEIYPHKYQVKDKLENIKNAANKYEANTQGEDKVQSAGRITAIRGHGKLFFFTVESDGIDLQLILNKGDEKIYKVANFIRRGDIVGFSGCCGKSRTGEPSVFLDELVLLAPCLKVIPSAKTGLSNPETIYRKRHLDLLVNKDSRERFINRTKIINYIKEYLNGSDFMEVETPMMNSIHGGAAAKPFKTHHNELKQDLFMRVAPELFLKRLVIGGFNRVYELGKQFRNEGIDLTHNPEFTSVEFYQAYADYQDMMEHVEKILNTLAIKIKGSEKFNYEPAKRGEESLSATPLDFSLPFKRIDILTELSKILNIELTGENISNQETLDLLIKVAGERNLKMEKPLTLSRVLDKFVGEYIEPQCINPTFVVGFPTETSPLAKHDRNRAGLVERFELFVNSKELCNAYTELNIPQVQRERFMMQAKDANAGDEEAMPVDEDFCQVMDYGLPPTGGCGIGIDRLVMYLTNAANIRDVLFFPAMRPENH
ncbi:lysyl-tRNA synthetase, class II [Enteropsectra breve]|nr:lysyl-tRNA synthetase, class II [Enteropsectra breve]